MRIAEIYAGLDTIRFVTDEPGKGLPLVRARLPLVTGDAADPFQNGRVVAEFRDALDVPRFAGDYDLLTCLFEAYDGGARVPGVCFVTETDPEMSRSTEPYPARGIKALPSWATLTDLDEMGIRQVACFEFNEVLLMRAEKGDTIEHAYNGKIYHLDRQYVEGVDKALAPIARRGIPAMMRYFNASHGYTKPEQLETVKITEHPAFDKNFDSAFIGAFNLRTEEGYEYFAACADFLFDRYTRPDRKYGWIVSMETGNEVTSQYIWNNAGDMTCSQFMTEYTVVMRTLWLLSRKYYAAFRVHTSFDQYFNGRHVPEQPTRYYGMKESVENIQANCDRDGDFPWNVAFHPYPENLSYPDFWNDRAPSWTLETQRITFKNIEVMPAFLSQPKFLYKGKPRRIIFPEQGFNSRADDPYTLLQGKYGYVLAYLKMRKLGTIDMFVHYAYTDNPGEFGLNLGIRYFGGTDADGKRIVGAKKPICDAIRVMDTPEEAALISEARDYIGHGIFDATLNPPEVLFEVDHSRDGLNIVGQGNVGHEEQETGQIKNFDT